MSEDNQEPIKATDENRAVVEKIGESMDATLYEKSQSLVDIANNTFKELCRTLENEQTKLLELEERRKKLQEEMQRLKMEIEEEKKSYRMTVMDVNAEGFDMLSADESTSSVNISDRLDEQSGEEMQRLKMEIEEEKKSYRMTVMDVNAEGFDMLSADESTSSVNISDRLDEQSGESVKDFLERQQTDLQKICSDSSQLLHPLDTCFEVDENNEDDAAAGKDTEKSDSNRENNEAGSGSKSSLNEAASAANNIHKQLQGVVAECIIEQCKLVEHPNAPDEVF